MLRACKDFRTSEELNNTFEYFKDRLTVISSHEGQQKLKFAIFGYFFHIIILAINDIRIVRDDLAIRWRCLSKAFSQRDMVL